MRARLITLSFAAATLAACSGGGGGGSAPAPVATAAPGGSATSSSQKTNEDAVAATNGVGTPLKNFSSYDETIASSAYSASSARGTEAVTATGTCRSGIEFFAPDSAGDANSTETKLFYDLACTQLARDAVRAFSSTGTSSESVTRTVSLYAPGDATPAAMRTTTETIANATFDQYGFPMLASGFTRSGTSSLAIAGTKTTALGAELVVQPASSTTNGFCDDTAGYSTTGSATLNETYGWAGGVFSGGTRTVNSDGSVTWSATHAGTAYDAPFGGLSLATGAPSAACPISTPAYALAGGTAVGTYAVPIVATYRAGTLIGLSIVGATLGNGDTLSVANTPDASFGNANFIVGSISKNGTQIATFSVDGFGDGALTVTATGAQFVITDWHVVK